MLAVGALVALCACLALAGCGSNTSSSGSNAGGSTQQGKPKSARIGVIEVAQVPIFSTYLAGFRAGFERVSGLTPQLDVKNAQGEVSLIENLALELPRGNYNMFVVIGTPAAIALAKNEKRRPIISIAMTDPVGAGVAQSLNRPGANVTGTTAAIPIASVVKFLNGMRPKPKTVGTIFDPSNEASASFSKEVSAALPTIGMKLVEASISGPGDVATAARSLVGRVDMILLGPDAIASGAGLPGIAAPARQNKLPLVIASGVAPNTPGATAVLAPPNEQLGELAGEQSGRIFLGKAQAASTPFITLKPQITVNNAAAAAVGVSFSDTSG
jgi:putative ABC transport system substrate-binding protein